MKRIVAILALLGIIYILGVLVRDEIKSYISNAALILSGSNSEKHTELILNYYNEKILAGKSPLNIETPVEIRMEHIDTDTRLDILAIAHSEATCGSGGCITTIFLQNESGMFEPIRFAYAVKKIEVTSTITNNMRDLIINDNTAHPLIWNGQTYSFSEI